MTVTIGPEHFAGPGKVGRLHPPTSHAAAHGATVRFGSQRWRALLALADAWPEGLTAAEVARHIGISRNQTATRLLELREDGWAERVFDPVAGTYVTRPTGPTDEGIVHRLTADALTAVPHLQRSRAMPIYVDRAALRAKLNELPEEAKRAAAAALSAHAKLSDDAYDDDPEALLAAANDTITAVAAHGITFVLPIDTTPYRAAFYDLPDDLRDEVNLTSRPFDVPHFDHAGRWTTRHAEVIGQLLATAEEEAATRLRKVHARLGEVGLDGDDTRHAIVAQLTGGRTNSSKGLTAPEAEYLDAAVDAVALSAMAFHPGAAKLVRAGTAEVVPPYVPDWRSIAKRFDTTQAGLTKIARSVAERLQVPIPTKVGDVTTDHRLVAGILRQLDRDRAASTIAEAFPGATNAETGEPIPPAPPPMGEGVGEDTREGPPEAPQATEADEYDVTATTTPEAGYVRLRGDVAGRPVIIVVGLDNLDAVITALDR